MRLVLTYVYSSISLQRELPNGPQGWLLLAEGAVTPPPHKIHYASLLQVSNCVLHSAIAVINYASNSLWYARTTFGYVLSQAKS